MYCCLRKTECEEIFDSESENFPLGEIDQKTLIYYYFYLQGLISDACLVTKVPFGHKERYKCYSFTPNFQ